jgi:hypothetical protein
LGTQLAHSSSYHPQSNGQTEIVNKCLEGYLRCFVSDKQAQWFKWLPLAEWWLHNRMKQQADQHHSERSFEVGDWVFLILQPYK